MGIHQRIVSASGRPSTAVSAVDLPGCDTNALEVALVDMTAAFTASSTDGRLGLRKRGDGHREHILGQMTTKLAELREQGAAAS